MEESEKCKSFVKARGFARTISEKPTELKSTKPYFVDWNGNMSS